MAIDIEKNKERVISLINSITDRDFDKTKVIGWLNRGDVDYFTAPASAEYYLAEDGGLCQHSLDVYDKLEELAKQYREYDTHNELSESNIIIVSLFHDISKVRYYEKYEKSVKNNITGKRDTILAYKTRDDKTIYGNHEENSEWMTRTFFPLTKYESMAILHHHGGTAYDSAQVNCAIFYKESLLTSLLYLADFIVTFLPKEQEEIEDERDNTETTE